MLPQVSHHCCKGFVVERHVVGNHSVYLDPAFAAGVLEVELDVIEGLVDLGVDFGVVFAAGGIPAACEERAI